MEGKKTEYYKRFIFKLPHTETNSEVIGLISEETKTHITIAAQYKTFFVIRRDWLISIKDTYYKIGVNQRIIHFNVKKEGVVND